MSKKRIAIYFLLWLFLIYLISKLLKDRSDSEGEDIEDENPFKGYKWPHVIK